MKKSKALIITTLVTLALLTACGDSEKGENINEVEYINIEVYDKTTHTDSYEQIGSNNAGNQTPQIIISDELKNWVEPEDNGVVALTYYESMKDMLEITEVHNEETYTAVEALSNELAKTVVDILGQYGNKYAYSALYEKANEVGAEYIDIAEFDDMGDGTYRFYIDFGTSENALYISDTEAFMD